MYTAILRHGNFLSSRRNLLQRAGVFAGALVPFPAWADKFVEPQVRRSREYGLMADGLTTVQSSFAAKETMDRLEAAVKAKSLTVFARVDHAAGAAEVGLQLRPTELLIFGNARGGTPLMQANQVAGIDLPLKALVYEDAAGKVWLAYYNPDWIAQRYALGADVPATVQALAKALDALAQAAAKSN
jgi:uncharacterized protein (DUF302 family)